MALSAIRQIGVHDPAPNNIEPATNHTFTTFPLPTLPGSTLIVINMISFFVGTFVTGASDQNGPTTNPVNGAYTLTRRMQLVQNLDLCIWKKENALSLPSGDHGFSTSATNGTMTDTSKSWTVNQHAGATVTNDIDGTLVVASNTTNTLTFTTSANYGVGTPYAVGGNFVSYTSAGGEDYPATIALEMINVAASSYAGDAYVAGSFAPGTDNISSGNTATLPAGNYGVIGFGMNSDAPHGAQVNTPSAGTGNTDKGAYWSWNIGQTNARLQFRNVTLAAPGTIASLMSCNSSSNYQAFAIALADGVAAPPAAYPLLPGPTIMDQRNNPLLRMDGFKRERGLLMPQRRIFLPSRPRPSL